MNIFFLTLGIILIIVTFIDALWTTIIPRGAGPLSGAICQTFSALLKKSPHSIRMNIQPVIGSISLLVIILGWMTMLWLGWWVLFCADPNSIVSTKNGVESGHIDRAYFSGYTLFTLGIGDFTPNGSGWQLATVVCSFSGLFLITLSISYMLPVLSTAIEKRQLAAMIRDLGSDPMSVLIESWDGHGFDQLFRKFSSTLSPMIHLHAQRHLEYPIIHYFHGNKPELSLAIGIATLDEAFTLIAHAIAAEARPHPSDILHARRAIGTLLEMLEGQNHRLTCDNPPSPDVARLGEAGIPLAHPDELKQAIVDLSTLRRLIRAFVEETGGEWQDVLNSNSFAS